MIDQQPVVRKRPTPSPTRASNGPAAAPPAPINTIPTNTGAVRRTTPVERVDRTGGIRLENLRSKAKPGLSAADRVDPYWEPIWGSTSGGSWSSVADQVAADDTDTPSGFAMPPAAAIDRVLTATMRYKRIAMLGAINSWATLTTHQAATLIGDAPSIDHKAAVITTLFASGLIDLGRSNPLSLFGFAVDDVRLLRPAGEDVFKKRIAPRLSLPEWTSITGGRPWAPHSEYPRHNVLAAELALRYAEYSDDIIGILGERFCTSDLLAGQGAGLEPIASDKHRTDATLIRRDGARIAIELVAYASPRLAWKVRWWTKLLASRPNCGLSVIFVIAGDVKGTRTDVRPAVYKAVQAAVREHPGPHYARTAERIGIVTWRELFPAAHVLAWDFFTLQVDRHTGPRHSPWQAANALDPNVLPGPPGKTAETLLQCIPNLAWMGQTPYWYRDAPLPVGLRRHPFANLALATGRNPDHSRLKRERHRLTDPAFPLSRTP